MFHWQQLQQLQTALWLKTQLQEPETRPPARAGIRISAGTEAVVMKGHDVTEVEAAIVVAIVTGAVTAVQTEAETGVETETGVEIGVVTGAGIGIGVVGVIVVVNAVVAIVVEVAVEVVTVIAAGAVTEVTGKAGNENVVGTMIVTDGTMARNARVAGTRGRARHNPPRRLPGRNHQSTTATHSNRCLQQQGLWEWLQRTFRVF